MKLKGVNAKLRRMGYTVVENADGFTAFKEGAKSVIQYSADSEGTVKSVTAVNWKDEKFVAYSLGSAVRFLSNHLLAWEKTVLARKANFQARHDARQLYLRGLIERRAAKLAEVKAVVEPFHDALVAEFGPTASGS